VRNQLLQNIKNIPGWTTKRKIVIFSVDDYGNIRMASKKARDNLKNKGLLVDKNRFDTYDSLETAEDLESLFNVLTSVKDINNRSAVFTAFSMSANINFSKIIENNFDTYYYEKLTDTFNNLPDHFGTWNMWQEGMRDKIFIPQFHGREHLNLKFFNRFLNEKNKELLACIQNGSYGGFSVNPFKSISYTAAFDFENREEIEGHKEIILDGLNLFEDVFGFRAMHFNAPGAHEHHSLENFLDLNGIKFIDTDLIKKEHQGDGKYSYRIYKQGGKNRFNQRYFIRNCIFEPLLKPYNNYVESCLKEIEIAFKWNKPANISSHRVNFAGKIDPKVRDSGLKDLKRLLKGIVQRWPDVEFMSSNELGELIANEK